MLGVGGGVGGGKQSIKSVHRNKDKVSGGCTVLFYSSP